MSDEYQKMSELLDNWLNVIKNLSFCVNEEYIQILINSKILQFLLNLRSQKEQFLVIIGNMSFIDNIKILSELYNLTIQYFINIILDNKNKTEIICLSLWCINNFTTNKTLCINAFLEKNLLLDIYKNYIIKNKNIDENIFYEICIGYKNLINYINENKAYIVIKKYNIISLVIKGFRKLENIEKIQKLGEIIVEIVFLLLTKFNEELINFNRYMFEVLGGNEYIFNKLNILIMEKKNYKIKEENADELNVLEFISFIQTKLLDYDKDD